VTYPDGQSRRTRARGARMKVSSGAGVMNAGISCKATRHKAGETTVEMNSRDCKNNIMQIKCYYFGS
jgi:hypothetical protein